MENDHIVDKELFVQILKDNKRILYKVINIYCRDIEDRRDLEQEIVIQLWKSLKSFNGNYKLSTWIYRVAMNVSISFYRTNASRKSNTTSIHESIFQDIEYDSADELDENRKLLHEFIDHLNEFNKQIIILHLEDFSYKEIADIIGITESNVGTKISRIKKILQEKFNQYQT